MFESHRDWQQNSLAWASIALALPPGGPAWVFVTRVLEISVLQAFVLWKNIFQCPSKAMLKAWTFCCEGLPCQSYCYTLPCLLLLMCGLLLIAIMGTSTLCTSYCRRWACLETCWRTSNCFVLRSCVPGVQLNGVAGQFLPWHRKAPALGPFSPYLCFD